VPVKKNVSTCKRVVLQNKSNDVHTCAATTAIPKTYRDVGDHVLVGVKGCAEELTVEDCD